MRPKSRATDLSSEEVVKEIRRATRKRYSAEEKIGIVLGGLRQLGRSVIRCCCWSTSVHPLDEPADCVGRRRINRG